MQRGEQGQLARRHAHRHRGRHRAGEATAIGDALRDLQAEGPKSYGWWTDAAGYEIWYGPVTAAVPVGMAAGELALLATLHESPAGFAAAC